MNEESALLIKMPGKQRVMISNVTPRVEGGHFPSKTVIGEELILSADVFSDGHDEISACAYIRPAATAPWKAYPMKMLINDQWVASFIPEQLGFYEFKIEGWVNHYLTWALGLIKKYQAGQDITVELEIGLDLIEQAAKTISAQVEGLPGLAASIRQAASTDSAVALATSNQALAMMYTFTEQDAVSTYPEIYQIEVERKKAAYSTWYELFPRSAAPADRPHGTFKDVMALLPRVAAMGFDVLYFPPIHPIGEKNRKGKNNSLTAGADDPGSPWAIGNRLGGHKAIHPQLGTLADFKALVKQAREKGIEVAMDIAFQCAPDHPYVQEHPQWFKWRPDGTVQYAENPPKKYEDILPFNFETDDWQNLWAELKSVIEYWVAAGVTIFRIDNPHTKAFRFWEWVIKEIRQAKPEVLFLAEAFTRPRVMERLAKAGFNQSYSYFTWRNSKYELQEYITQLTKTPMRYYFRPNFWPNTPDILPPALINGGENAHIMRLILAATLSSNYGLYGPVYEFGINQPHGAKEEYVDNEKYEIKHWDWKQYTRIAEVITRVNRIRKQNSALQTTWNIEFAQTSNEQILCYAKYHRPSGNLVVVVVNMDVWNTQGAHINIPFEKLGLEVPATFKLYDMLSGEQYQWASEWNFVQLNPYQMPAHIFKIEMIR